MVAEIYFFETLPDTDPRTCTRLGRSGGVNVGAGWCSSVRYFWYCYHSTSSGYQIRVVYWVWLVYGIWFFGFGVYKTMVSIGCEKLKLLLFDHFNPTEYCVCKK